MGGEGGRSVYGFGEKLRSGVSGRIISAQDSVGERGDGSPEGGAVGGRGCGCAIAIDARELYWVAAEHVLDSRSGFKAYLCLENRGTAPCFVCLGGRRDRARGSRESRVEMVRTRRREDARHGKMNNFSLSSQRATVLGGTVLDIGSTGHLSGHLAPTARGAVSNSLGFTGIHWDSA